MTDRVIEVFADACCPFTHVGLRRFVEHRTRAGRTDVVLRVRAWPLEIVNGQPLDPQPIAEEVEALRATVAPDLFTCFDREAFPSTSVPAMALAAAAYRKDPRTGETMSLAIRGALFEEGCDISDPAVLGSFAQRFGVSASSSDDDVVRAEYQAGQERGVVGSPHFFTPEDSFFCPALDISRDDHDRLHITVDDAGFERFVAACLSTG